jgi:hypothetical protein
MPIFTPIRSLLRFFSRNGKDFTDAFGDCPESGKFCKFLSRYEDHSLCP